MLRTRRLIILVLIVVFVFFGLLFSLANSLRTTNKKIGSSKGGSEKIPQVVIVPGTNLSPRVFLLEKGVQTPSQADLYSVDVSNFAFTETLAKGLARTWGFFNEPKADQTQDGRSLLFISPTNDRLVINENPFNITFSKNIPISEPLPKLTITETQATAWAQEFLARIVTKFPPGFSLRSLSTELLKSAGPYTRRVQSLEDANEIRIVFGIYLDDHRLFTESSPDNAISVSLFGNGTISSAQATLPFGLGVNIPTISKEASVVLRNEDEVREAIRNRQAVIKTLMVATDSREENLMVAPDYLTLTNFETGYLAVGSGGKSYLYPIYVFRATGPLASGETVDGVVYLPAVK